MVITIIIIIIMIIIVTIIFNHCLSDIRLIS